MHSRIIVALDGMEARRGLELARELRGHVWGVKVNDLLDGKSSSAHIVEQLVALPDVRVFADIKAHDIPNTVRNRVERYAEYGADLITVHASGYIPMMRAAIEAFERKKRPEALGILAVTVLTSLDGFACSRVYGKDAPQKVLELTEDALEAGVHGIVCSPKEIDVVRRVAQKLNRPKLSIVTPGVRIAGADTHDQERVATPGEAVKSGASFLVIGRDITNSKDPVGAAKLINTEVNRALVT